MTAGFTKGEGRDEPAAAEGLPLEPLDSSGEELGPPEVLDKLGVVGKSLGITPPKIVMCMKAFGTS